jgi:superfamily II RNA helicase
LNQRSNSRSGRTRGNKKTSKKNNSSPQNRSSQGGGRKKTFRGSRNGRSAHTDSRDESASLTPALRASISAAVKQTSQELDNWFHPKTPTEHKNHPIDDSISLDPWQQQAVKLLFDGESVIIDAPTTAGKTRIVETYFRERINEPNFRAAYTTPVKSLTNDKLSEFRKMFGSENVGISTGDIKENLNAPIVVATLESYRNSLLGTEPDLGRNLVVFDEYHFMQDNSRGSAWEESIILSPPDCQLLMLSASVKNAEDFGSWLEVIRKKPCKIIRTTHRPVPLIDLINIHGSWVLADQITDPALRRVDHRKMKQPEAPPVIAQKAAQLEKLSLLPCIIYTGRRLSTEIIARHLQQNFELLPEEKRTLISDKINEINAQNNALRFVDPALRNMLISYGIAYHHSGLAAPARVLIEKLLKAGLLRCCVATMGLSIGINFAVRSALISDYTRPDERGLVEYESGEVLQMLGRAGRRGRDPVGFSLWPNVESYTKFSKAQRDNCYSNLKMDPATFLGLLNRYPSLRELEDFYGRSFQSFISQYSDLKLLRKYEVKKSLKVASLPCTYPAIEYTRFLDRRGPSLCPKCKLKKNCHNRLRNMASNPLAVIQQHLIHIGAVRADHQLSDLGETARYFPQPGGLLIAKWITEEKLREDNMLACTQLMASLALPQHKSPHTDDSYKFPFDFDEIDVLLGDLYPQNIFKEMYDEKRGMIFYRDFNPSGGFVIKQWIQGMKWSQLERNSCHEKFGSGDLMNLIYRTATFLQSVAMLDSKPIAAAARQLRHEILREPLTISIFNS